MKDLTNKGNMGNESRLTLELNAFRDLVSSEFDNSQTLHDTCLEAENLGREAVNLDAPQSEVDMRDLSASDSRSNVHLSDVEVESLARRALSVLASGFDGVDASTPLSQLFALTDAYIGPDETHRQDTLARVLNNGVDTEDLVEAVVPDTARYMGELWANDKLSFADVTIGAARLQETVRNISERHISDTRDKDSPSVLLVVPRTEQHTLGIFVAAEQFRRQGVYVHLTLGNNSAEILKLIRKHRFAMVGISASSRRTLASVRDLVKTIRTGIPRILPIVVGGPVMDLNLNIKAMTGADYVTSNATEALEFCGVETTTERERPS